MNSADLLFSGANALAAGGWIALALTPAGARHAALVRRITGRYLPLAFAAVYLALMAMNLPGSGGGYDSIAQVQRLFAVPDLLLAGWLHYLAFDLFVGAWIAGRAAERACRICVVLPLLLLTFMFGPVGLLAYAVLRATLYREPAARRAVPHRPIPSPIAWRLPPCRPLPSPAPKPIRTALPRGRCASRAS